MTLPSVPIVVVVLHTARQGARNWEIRNYRGEQPVQWIPLANNVVTTLQKQEAWPWRLGDLGMDGRYLPGRRVLFNRPANYVILHLC
jgi:hypothetical protein